MDFENALRELPDAIIGGDPWTTHHHGHKVYGREIKIPAGIMLTGKIHRNATLNILISGKCLQTTEYGSEVIEGPMVWVGEPGIKRALYTLTEVHWVTAHGTEETDITKIEDEVIVPSFEALEQERKERLT
ncbi:MAG: hypothetical protein ACRDL7_07240 [Gaiellaceae bacterium]